VGVRPGAAVEPRATAHAIRAELSTRDGYRYRPGREVVELGDWHVIDDRGERYRGRPGRARDTLPTWLVKISGENAQESVAVSVAGLLFAWMLLLAVSAADRRRSTDRSPGRSGRSDRRARRAS
jgi:hypothetical protein